MPPSHLQQSHVAEAFRAVRFSPSLFSRIRIHAFLLLYSDLTMHFSQQNKIIR